MALLQIDLLGVGLATLDPFGFAHNEIIKTCPMMAVKPSADQTRLCSFAAALFLRYLRNVYSYTLPPARFFNQRVGALIAAAYILSLQRLSGGHAAGHHRRISIDPGLHVVKHSRYYRTLPGLQAR